MSKLESLLPRFHAELNRLEKVGFHCEHELEEQQNKVKSEVEKILSAVHEEEKRKLVSLMKD